MDIFATIIIFGRSWKATTAKLVDSLLELENVFTWHLGNNHKFTVSILPREILSPQFLRVSRVFMNFPT